ncbi:hypothetical protein [Desulfurobacterium sp.]
MAKVSKTFIKRYCKARYSFLQDFGKYIYDTKLSKKGIRLLTYRGISVFVTQHMIDRYSERLGNRTGTRIRITVDLADIIDILFLLAERKGRKRIPSGKYNVFLWKINYVLSVHKNRMTVVTLYKVKRKREFAKECLSFLKSQAGILPETVSMIDGVCPDIKDIKRFTLKYLPLFSIKKKMYFCERKYIKYPV